MRTQGRYAGRLVSLRRYPVKSLVGERLDEADVDERGLVGDRLWALRDADGKLASGKSTRRFRRTDGLLTMASRYDGEVPVVTLPDGTQVRGDDPGVHAVVSGVVGREVHLAREGDVMHHDEGPLHLLTHGDLARLGSGDRGPDERRFRPNLVLDTAVPSTEWLGLQVAVGPDVVVRVAAPMPRCVMIGHSQQGLPEVPRLLRALAAVSDGPEPVLGVLAHVVRPGQVALGHEARVSP